MSNPSASQSDRPSRRQFLGTGIRSAWLMGLGAALGWRQRTDAAPAAGGSSGSGLGKAYTLDLSHLRQVDPKLVQYDESGKIPSGLRALRGLTVNAQDQIVAAGDQSINIFNSAGTPGLKIGCSSAPRCAAVDAQGLLYVGFKDHLEVFKKDGSLQARWANLSGKPVITSVAVTDRYVFAADAGNRVVVRYDRTGKLETEFGRKDPARNVPGFIVPSPYFDVCIGPEALLWVANPGRHRVEAYTFDGAFESSWGQPANSIEGFCGCCNPAHLARLPDGRFVTSEKGLPRIKIYSAKGDFEGVVAVPDQFADLLDNPGGSAAAIEIAVDSNGRVLAADPRSQIIRCFTRRPKV